jgi:CheY-like chemotaxis protein
VEAGPAVEDLGQAPADGAPGRGGGRRLAGAPTVHMLGVWPGATNYMADILVVDDDGDTAAMLQIALEHDGHRVRVSGNGLEGLQALRERLPDLCLLDVEMPLMTGPDPAVRMLIEDCGMELVPVVLVSGIFDLPGTAALVGIPYFLSKPYPMAALRTVVARALAGRRGPAPPGPHPVSR